ncbi:MAG TPA: Holliday junction resolvase RuvX [Puia sp.]|nr:Holliday junction resolvase RuvX [Puia sp.]
MARILAIDYGLKRTGIAVTDPLQIIASALTTVESARIFTFLQDYLSKEPVELILIGDPKNLDGGATDATPHVQRIIGLLRKKFPDIPVLPVDERHSSVLANRAMKEMALSRNKQRDKGIVDRIAATILLQEYLDKRAAGG